MLINEKVTRFKSLTPDLKSNPNPANDFPNFVYPESKFQKADKILAEVSPVNSGYIPNQKTQNGFNFAPSNLETNIALGTPMQARMSLSNLRSGNGTVQLPHQYEHPSQENFSFKVKKEPEVQIINNPSGIPSLGPDSQRGHSLNYSIRPPNILRAYTYVDPQQPRSSLLLKTPYPVRIIDPKPSIKTSIAEPVRLASPSMTSTVRQIQYSLANTQGPIIKHSISPKQSLTGERQRSSSPSRPKNSSVSSNKSGTVFFIDYDFDDLHPDPRRTISHSPSIARKNDGPRVKISETKSGPKQSKDKDKVPNNYAGTISTNIQQNQAYQVRPIDMNRSVEDLKLFLESSKVFTESQRNIVAKFQENSGTISNGAFQTFQSLMTNIETHLVYADKLQSNTSDLVPVLQEKFGRLKLEFEIVKDHIQYAYKVGSIQSGVIKQLNQELAVLKLAHEAKKTEKGIDYEKEFYLLKIKLKNLETTKEKHLNDSVRINQEYQQLFEKYTHSKILVQSFHSKIKELETKNDSLAQRIRSLENGLSSHPQAQDQKSDRISQNGKEALSEERPLRQSQFIAEISNDDFSTVQKNKPDEATPENDKKQSFLNFSAIPKIDLDQLLGYIDYKTKVCSLVRSVAGRVQHASKVALWNYDTGILQNCRGLL